jgi:hypothetical protein
MGKKENIIPVSAEVNTEEQWLALRDLQVKLKQFEKATKKSGRFFHISLFLYIEVQVNLCQKHLFLEQLIHNMAKNCSLIYHFST